jgi:sodium-dependent dicarboxylate transporter 2/3/5
MKRGVFMSSTTHASANVATNVNPKKSINITRLAAILAGLGLFALFYFLPSLTPAVDPMGNTFELSREGQLAIGLFLLAGVWWVFEVIPIGVTSLLIGVTQVVFFIRPADQAFGNFADSSVLFILGSLMLGLAFTKVGLTNRMAFKMLTVVGEDSRKILLGVFLVTVGLTLVMAHTAVAATMFPLMMVILKMYDEDEKPSKFGKAMFIGMAYAAGAGSMITMLGAARTAVAAGFFQEFTGNYISFLEVTMAMGPFGIAMTLITWFLLAFIFCKPEKKNIPGLKEKAQEVYSKMGPLSKKEMFVAILALTVVTVLALQSFIPALAAVGRTVPILIAIILLFLTKTFTVEDLEKGVPWNIVLLFGGAMSIGLCLWETGAAQWMAVHWLGMFNDTHWLVFLLGIAFLIIVLTNFIMNVAAISITLPVALVVAGYLGVNPYMILYVSLATAALPYMLLVGAAPNAIAYQSKQFTTGQFFTTGIPFTIIAIAMVGLFALTIWPLLGIPALLP